jgi:hypothetical protein
VAALIVRAIDQDPAHASGAHFCKGDLRRAGEGGHSPIKARHEYGRNPVLSQFIT